MAKNGRACHWAGQGRAIYAEVRSTRLNTSKYTFRCCSMARGC